MTVNLPSFLRKPLEPAPGTMAAKKACIETITKPKPMPAPVVDLYRLRSQVAQLSDADFRAMVVTEANARNMTGLWRELP